MSFLDSYVFPYFVFFYVCPLYAFLSLSSEAKSSSLTKHHSHFILNL